MKKEVKEEILKKSIEKGFTRENGCEVRFVKDRYSSGIYSGQDDEIILLYGYDRHKSRWAEELIKSDDITAASFWYDQKIKSYKDRCAFTPNEYLRYLNDEAEKNDIGHGLTMKGTKIYKEDLLESEERLIFLMTNGLEVNTETTKEINSNDVKITMS